MLAKAHIVIVRVNELEYVFSLATAFPSYSQLLYPFHAILSPLSCWTFEIIY